MKALLPTELTDEVKQAIRDDITKARAESDNGNGSGVNGMKYAPIATKHNVSIELVAEIAKEPDPTRITNVNVWYVRDGRQVSYSVKASKLSEQTLAELWKAKKGL